MRILHVIGTLDPAAGGPTESVRVLLTFGPIGYTGEVVTLDEPNAPFLQNLPFRVHALGPQGTKYGFNGRLLPWIRENRHRFDGVVVNGLWQYCGFATWLAVRKHVPYVVFTHGMLDPWFKQTFPLKHVKKYLYWAFAEYWILRRAHRVLFTSQEESRLARKSFAFYQWNGLVVPYGAARPPTGESAQREAFYTQLPAMRNQRFLLFLGRIHRKKGCDLLVQAFGRAAHLDPELHLVMAGPDQQDWVAELKQIAATNRVGARVHWPGMLHGSAKWGALFVCEAFVLPSHQENFGIAVAEALACGRPALLANQVNIAPEIEADGAGFVQPDTLAGTEALLRSWIALSTEEKKAMGARASACFNRRYDMRNNAETIIRLFETACVQEAA